MKWKGMPGWQKYGPRYVVRSTIIKNILKRFPAGINALDVGCGKGTFTEILARNGFYVDAIDSSSEAVKYSLEKLKKYENVNIFVGDILTFETGKKYDLITMFEVLEHIEDDLKTLQRIRKLLNAEGKLILSVPAHPYLWSLEDIEGGHIRRYTKEELREKLERSGFEIEKFLSWGFPIIVLWYKFEIFLVKRKSLRILHDIEDNPLRKLLAIFYYPLYMLAIFEKYFSNIDKGIGYIVVCRKK